MTITLNQKDADFIIKYLRMELERINEARTDLKSSYSDLQKLYTERLKNNQTATELINFAKEITDFSNDITKEAKNDLEKCILLLTVGSEVKE